VGFKERNSHRIVDVNRCLLITDDANNVLDKVRRWFADEPGRATNVVSFEILQSTVDALTRQPPESGRILLHFVVKKRGGPSRSDLKTLAREWGLEGLVVTEDGAPESSRRARIGQSRVIHRIGDIEYQARVGSFFQVNRFLVGELVEEVLTLVEGDHDKVVDLYCGVGLFTLPLARNARFAVGVETSSAARLDAKVNARRAGVMNVDFVLSDARRYVTRMGLEGVELVVVDPPRGGLDRTVVEALKRHPPQTLCYVSCDPAALGRDVGRLSQGGFELERVALLDMFPNTAHFETVATFRPR
jgi:23S rRNA (uracil1939-C5)-methyltransferase